MHESGGRWVGSNKLVELKKKKSKTDEIKCGVVTQWGITSLEDK